MVKISRPVPKGVYLRKRLFERLDELRQNPVTWVSAPAGSGKTTLIGSYIEEEHLPCLWYQLDSGDGDIATFFYYLGLAGRHAAPKKRHGLPLLTAEYMQGVPTFTLRFFEELYRRLERPAVIVFDNYQDVPAESALHDVMVNAMSILPQDLNIIVISRNDPVPAMIRLKANRQLDVLDWNDVRLAGEETREIIRIQLRHEISEEMIGYLTTMADGWAAGLTLMTETMRRKGLQPQFLGRYTQEEIFNYFAQEVFSRLEESIRRFMLKTAFLLRMSEKMARELTGESAAGRILSAMYRRNYFIQEHFDPEPVYEYHPLYREFLLARAGEALGPEDLTETRRSAAMIMDKMGQSDAAIDLLKHIRDWDGMVAIIMSHAPHMVKQGRYLPLQGWLGSLPEAVLQNNPWLLYWKAFACLPFSPARSKPLFEQAFDLFNAAGNMVGSLMAASGAVNAIAFSFSDFTPLDGWYTVLNDLVERMGTFPTVEIEAWVTASIMIALALRESTHKDAAAWCRRVLALKETPDTIQPKANALYHLYWYNAMRCGFQEIEEALGELKRLARTHEAHPLALITAHLVEAMYHEETGRHAECLASVSECLSLSGRIGVHILDNMALLQAISSHINQCDWKGAREWISRVASAIENAPPFLNAAYHLFRARMAHLRGNLEEAALQVDLASTLACQVGSPYAIGLCHLVKAQVLHKMGNDQEAAAFLARVYQVAGRHNNNRLRAIAYKYETHLHFDNGEEAEALQTLRDWLSLGKKHGYTCFLDDPSVTLWLCEKALGAGIEVEYAQEIIRSRGMADKPPPIHVENWPWPVKINTLGGFNVMRDGKAITFSRKAQQKPLNLLKALIALGGAEVSDGRVSDLLWPDAEGDLAHQSLKTTLHRLRKLLGSMEAIRTQEGKLSLDGRICWVDALAFEQLLDEAEALKTRGKPEQVCELTDRAIQLYHGMFLSGEPEEWWAASMSEHLQARYVKAVLWMLKYLEDLGRWEEAAAYCERSIALYPLAEDIYRRLMVCYRNLGRRREALAVYDRLKRALKTELNETPSPETEELRGTVLEPDRGGYR